MRDFCFSRRTKIVLYYMMVAQRGRFWNDSFGDLSRAVCLNRQYRTLVRYGLSVFWSFSLSVSRLCLCCHCHVQNRILFIILYIIYYIYLLIIKEVRVSEKFLVLYTQKTERPRDPKDILM